MSEMLAIKRRTGVSRYAPSTRSIGSGSSRGSESPIAAPTILKGPLSILWGPLPIEYGTSYRSDSDAGSITFASMTSAPIRLYHLLYHGCLLGCFLLGKRFMSVVQLMVLKPLLLPLLPVDLLVRLGQLNLRMALMIRLLYMMGRLLDQQVLKSDKLAYYYLCDMDPDEGRKEAGTGRYGSSDAYSDAAIGGSGATLASSAAATLDVIPATGESAMGSASVGYGGSGTDYGSPGTAPTGICY